MKVPKEGTALGDKTLDNMFQAYQHRRSVYYVAEENEKILGCAGIAPLQNYDGNLCELQKMYVDSSFRGKGLATMLLKRCLETAVTLEFEGCYLETLPSMRAAQQLYQKMGFHYIKDALGDTGHTACSVRMLKNF